MRSPLKKSPAAPHSNGGTENASSVMNPMLSARAHTTLRLLAIILIALAALVPRAGSSRANAQVASQVASQVARR